MKSTYTITNDNNNIEVNLIALHNLLKESSIQATFSYHTIINIGNNILITIDNSELIRYKSEIRQYTINNILNDKDNL
jgi:hypothetical protein